MSDNSATATNPAAEDSGGGDEGEGWEREGRRERFKVYLKTKMALTGEEKRGSPALVDD